MKLAPELPGRCTQGTLHSSSGTLGVCGQDTQPWPWIAGERTLVPTGSCPSPDRPNRTCLPFPYAQHCRVVMKKVFKITWLPGWSVGMDAGQSHWFCTLSSTVSSVGHQLHHPMDELPMPCPNLVPDFTSLQSPAQQPHKLLICGLAQVLLQTQGRV